MNYLPIIFPILTLIAVIATAEIQVNPSYNSDDMSTEEEADYGCGSDETYRDTPTAKELNDIFFPNNQ